MAATFRALKKRLNELPRTVAAGIAKRAAPALTGLAQGAFASAVDVYGVARPKSEVDGAVLTLHRTGEAAKALGFKAEGTIVRATLARPYIKYLIGKYRILPNGPIPVAWRAKLDALVQTERAP